MFASKCVKAFGQIGEAPEIEISWSCPVCPKDETEHVAVIA